MTSASLDSLSEFSLSLRFPPFLLFFSLSFLFLFPFILFLLLLLLLFSSFPHLPDTDNQPNMDSEPFLNTDKLSDAQNRNIVLGVTILTLIYMAVSIILLLVYAFSSNIIFPNILMSSLILLQFGLCFVLNRWRMNDDTDDRFKYILMAGVFILIISCTVGIIYSVTVEGITDPCSCPSWSCFSGFYANKTAQCIPICSTQPGGGMNNLMNTSFFTSTRIAGNCLSC